MSWNIGFSGNLILKFEVNWVFSISSYKKSLESFDWRI